MYKDRDRDEEEKITYCRMCDAGCGLKVGLVQGQVREIAGLKEHPLNRGRLCVKGRAMRELLYSPRRLKRPLKRVGERWEELPLQEAIEEIAEKMKRIKERTGSRSLSVWKGEGVGFNQQEDYARRFAHAIGTPNYFSNDTLCAVSKKAARASLLGTYPLPDLENADAIILWGTNPFISNPMLGRKILQAKERGATIILIDPRETSTAKAAHLYLPIKPGTDGALALGIIKILVERDWYDHDFVEEYTLGFQELVQYVRSLDLEWISIETGIPKSQIERVAAILYKRAPKTTTMVGVGLEHHENGFQSTRAIASMGVLLGAVDGEGGDLLPEEPGFNRLTLYEERPLLEREPIGAKEYPLLYDFHRECHTLLAMDAILTHKPYPLCGMIMTGANPLLTNPDTKKVRRALSKLQLLVVRDLFMTETAELADYVLPAASFLERSEILTDLRGQRLFLRKKIVDSPSQDEYQFWHHLAHALGCKRYFPWKDEEEVNQWLLEPLGLSVEDLEEHPQGYPYLPRRYEKYKEEPFKTPSGKIEFYSKYLEEQSLSPLPIYHSPAYLSSTSNQEYPFTLITGARMPHFCNSRYHNLPSFKALALEPLLEMNPEDGERLKVKSGEEVLLTSNKGSLRIRVQLTRPHSIRQGSLQLTHGFSSWNVNELTSDEVVDPVMGFPAIKSTPVQVEKIEH